MPFFSMTGFGRGETKDAGARVVCEIKSVNNRHLDVNVRLPRAFWAVEPRVREAVARSISRGRVDLFLSVEETHPGEDAVHLDEDLAATYFTRLRALQQRLGIADEIRVTDLVRLDGVMRVSDSEADVERTWPVVEKALADAVERLIAMRRGEGEALRRELAKIESALSAIAEEMTAAVGPACADLERRLTEKIEALTQTPGIDPVRLHQEVAVLLAKADVAEEVTRLRGHLEAFRAVLSESSPVGKRLDFLVQEIHREITTFGNKLQGREISALVVRAKTEAEKLREQIQNIE
ncbi:MAG: YicC family protein [Deltaproteobacteria bacterium]|nr:YicC family protein [Deltaproteobacteria bacterium]